MVGDVVVLIVMGDVGGEVKDSADVVEQEELLVLDEGRGTRAEC